MEQLHATEIGPTVHTNPETCPVSTQFRLSGPCTPRSAQTTGPTSQLHSQHLQFRHRAPPVPSPPHLLASLRTPQIPPRRSELGHTTLTVCTCALPVPPQAAVRLCLDGHLTGAACSASHAPHALHWARPPGPHGRQSTPTPALPFPRRSVSAGRAAGIRGRRSRGRIISRPSTKSW